MTIAIASRVGASEFPATAPTVTMRSAKQPPLGVGSTATSIHAPLPDSDAGEVEPASETPAVGLTVLPMPPEAVVGFVWLLMRAS
jgi:hypothetical protein